MMSRDQVFESAPTLLEMSKRLSLRVEHKRFIDIKRKVTKSQKRVSNPLLTRLGHHGVTPEAPNHFITDLPIET
jgi:hypothetical protein